LHFQTTIVEALGMEPIYKKYLRTTSLVWGVCFVLLAAAYYLVLSPQKGTIKGFERVLAEKKQLYETAVRAAQEKTKALQAQEIEELKSRLADFVVESDESANLTLDISQAAGQKNLKSLTIESKSKVASPSVEIPGCKHIFEDYINISFTAGFNEFAAFLNSLERHRPVVFVDTFKIVRSSEEDSKGHAAEMDLAVFVGKYEAISNAEAFKQLSKVGFDNAAGSS